MTHASAAPSSTVLLAGGAESDREALAHLLGEEPGIEVSIDHGELVALPARVDRLSPSLVLIDVRLPDIAAVLACREIRGQRPDARVAFLVTQVDALAAASVVMANATGAALKTLDRRAAARSLRALLQCPPESRGRAAGALIERYERVCEDATEEDRELMRLIASGAPDRLIAERLALDPISVRSEVARLYVELCEHPAFRRR